MAGGGVHQACAGLGGDVVAADHHLARALQQRMAVDDSLERGAFYAQQRREREAQAGFQAFTQLGGYHQMAHGRSEVVALGCHGADGVVEPFIHRHRQVGGQGPGGGGPDGHSQATGSRGGIGAQASGVQSLG